MIKRTIDISEPAYLHVQHGQLLIDKDEKTVCNVPIEDLGVLILQNPAIVITHAAIIACQKNNAVIVFCNEKHLPYSLVLSLSDSHCLHSKIIRQQIDVSIPTCKKIWQKIICFKIEMQAKVLIHYGKDAAALLHLSKHVKSGDSGNLEAQAAQKYWRLLFGKSFRRDVNAEGINSLLNYGYAILRASIARAIVGSGLHPALGLKHTNQYNSLCLADDLMEPLRPWVDYHVYRLSQNTDNLSVNKETKQPLLKLLSELVIYQQKTMPFMVASHYLLADFKRALFNKISLSEYPKWLILQT